MANPLRVLIIDDNDGDRKLLRDCVERAGIGAVVNETGSDVNVAKLYRSDPADCVLLDFFLQGNTGAAVLQELKAIDRYPPVVMTTGHDNVEVAVAALKAGAHDCVAKNNINPQSIGGIIANVAKRVAMLRKIDTQYVDLESFARALAHDLDAPLTALRGSATLLEHELAHTPCNLASVRRFAASITRNARRMGALIVTLTEFVSVEGFVEFGRVRAAKSAALTQAIVDTIREPLLVLDKDLRVVLASAAFYKTFEMDKQQVQGRPVYALGDGQWDIPQLRLLLESIVPKHTAMDAYEVEQDFAGMGRRTMLLNARQVFYQGGSHATILLAIEDISERRARERELQELLQQKELLLQEIRRRVANSLQIIASILLIKARTVRSKETRLHLQDAHQRVISIAAMQDHLRVSEPGASIDIQAYLSRLCETLAASMIGESRPISLQVQVQFEGGTASSTDAVSIGLIVTELVINAIKYAFPGNPREARIIVAYDWAEPNWRLTVSDNGIDKQVGHLDKINPGLGTSIVAALAKQLDARVDVRTDARGTKVSITHAVFLSRAPEAA
jgi:two-component sensor histidine kinase/FixJ family two-component response regulator